MERLRTFHGKPRRLTIIGVNMAMKLKKALGSAIKAGVTAAKAAYINPAVQGVKALADISRGDSDALENRFSNFLKTTGEDTRAATTNLLNAPGQFFGANDSFGGSSVKTSSELAKEKAKGILEADDAKIVAEEAARPEKERKALFQKQYQNLLLQSGNRKFNSLLGGGGY